MKKRNDSFDFLKGIACLAVVLMHIELPGTAGTIVQCMTRWSVPLFFAVSGWFLKSDDPAECRRKALRIAKMALYASLFYAVLFTILHLISGDLGAYFRKEVTPLNLALWVVFNNPCYINGALWFLFALIYTYLAYAFMVKRGLTKHKLPICIILLVCHFALAYLPAVLHIRGVKSLYRNWLFEGLAFFLLGRILSERTAARPAEYRPGLWALLIFGGLLLSLPERYLIGHDFSVHMSSVATLIGMLLWAAGRGSAERRLPQRMVTLGRDLSLYVYIIHNAVYRTLLTFLTPAGIREAIAVQWALPFVVLLLSILIAVCMFRIKQGRTNAAQA